MATAQQIIVAGLAKSFHNRPDTLATSGTELVGVVQRELTGMFAVAARVNRDTISRRFPVGFDGVGWTRPSGIESIWLIRDSQNRDVVTVPYDELQAAEGDPAVTFLDGAYIPTGLPDGPSTGTLTFYAVRVPVALVDLSSPVDPAFPEQFNPILELRVAIYLAQKDKRVQDAAMFEAEWDKWFGLYVAHLEHHTTNLVRRTGIPRNGPTPALAVLKQLVMGGQADEKATP